MTEPDVLLTADEVARWLSFRPQTIRQWARQGYLPALMIGKDLRFRRADVERWLREQTEAYRARQGGPQRKGNRPAPRPGRQKQTDDSETARARARAEKKPKK